MKKLILIITMLIGINTYGQTKKGIKALNSVDIVLTAEIDEIETITVIHGGYDFADFIPVINRELIRNKVKVLSENAVMNTLAMLQYNSNSVEFIAGGHNSKSNLVLKFDTEWVVGAPKVKNSNFEILDLSKDGLIIGTGYLPGAYKNQDAAYGIVNKLLRELNRK